MSEIHKYIASRFSDDKLRKALELAQDQKIIFEAEQTIGVAGFAVKFMKEHQGSNQDLVPYVVGLCLLLTDMPQGEKKDEFKQRLHTLIEYFYKLSIFGRSELIRSLVTITS